MKVWSLFDPSSRIYKCCFYTRDDVEKIEIPKFGILQTLKSIFWNSPLWIFIFPPPSPSLTGLTCCTHLQSQQPLGEGRGCHLHPALVTGVYLEVVSVGGVQPQQTQALGPSVLPCNVIVIILIVKIIVISIDIQHQYSVSFIRKYEWRRPRKKTEI